MSLSGPCAGSAKRRKMRNPFLSGLAGRSFLPSGSWRLSHKLPKVFHGASRGHVYPSICHELHLYALATELWTIVFDVERRWWSVTQRGISTSPPVPRRKPVAEMARISLYPTRPRRAKLRGQALTWFRAEVSATAKAADRGTPEANKSLLGTVQGWQETPDFAGVRDTKALAKLPESERRSWLALWADVEVLEKRLRSGPS